ETQANHVACWSALLANATKKPVKIRLTRDEDQKFTGKRHPFLIYYETGFDPEGKILAHSVEYHTDGGSSTDLTRAILERAMLHADNAYFLPNVKITGISYKTNLPSNTAFRGFGGPQGMVAIETVIDRIARFLKKDSLDIRKINFYQNSTNNTTPYKELVENNRLGVLEQQLSQSSNYYQRRKQINLFNQQNVHVKKGIACTPVKFGISFTTSFLNQAGALVNIYKDGSVLVHHGGTEMGQGLHTKIRIIAAKELGVSLQKVKVHSTNTSIVPNTSATAASTGTDLNGMAVKNAIDKLKKRISEGMADYFSTKNKLEPKSSSENIAFDNEIIFDKIYPKRFLTFSQMAEQMHLQQVSLSATGFYRTPEIYFDKEKGEGKPFHYFSFGMAVTEVMIDVLTGEHKILRADILHDVGDSIHKGIDIGQVEGGFIQGAGWCTSEQLRYDNRGNLLNHSPDTYKIPGVTDIPEDFRVSLLEGFPNPNTIRKSKAVAEPPLMLAFSVWLAIKDAISAVRNHEIEPEFSLPATREVILRTVEGMRRKG
ncbi:MAG: xanthine dehydrogenase molybdopterin binding subunit, partial [Bacteroidetes bacterium RIFCSPLOWO2_12_FULL_37_12]